MKSFLGILRYAAPYWMFILLGAMCLVVATLLNFASLGAMIPLLDASFSKDAMATLNRIGVNRLPGGTWLSDILVRVFSSGGARPMLLVVGFIVACTMLKTTASFLHSYTASYIMNRISMDVSRRLYLKIQSQPLVFFHRKSTGDLISRVTNDVEQMREGLIVVFQNVIKDPVMMAGYVIFLLLLNWRLALLSFVVLPVSSYAIYRLGRRSKRRSRRAWDVRGRLAGFLEGCFSGIRIVKAYNAEGFFAARFERLLEEMFHQFLKIARIRAFSSPSIEMLYTVSFSVILLGSLTLGGGTASAGGFVAFFAALASLYGPLRRLAYVQTSLNMGIASAERILEVLQLPGENAGTGAELTSPPREISFHDVSFSYDGSRQVLEGVSLRLEKGRVTAIVGPSGSGKTTIVNLLLRLYEPSAGEILVDGRNAADFSPSSIRRHAAVVSQDVFIFHDTLRNNITMGDEGVSEEEILRAVRMARVDEFIDRLPRGLDTVIGEGIGDLSRGQMQRITLARAIVKRPAVFVLDEVTSSIDPHQAASMLADMEEFMRERITLIISHQLDQITFADEIIVLEDGRIEDRGRHEDLLASSGVYRRMFTREKMGESA